MPLEGTCGMQERFQAFPGTERELTFNLSSALQGRDKFPLFVSPTSCRDHPGSWRQTCGGFSFPRLYQRGVPQRALRFETQT